MKKNPFTPFLIALISFGSFLILPASAQTPLDGAKVGITTIGSLITLFTDQVITALGTLLLSAGVLAFFYGVIQYIWGLRKGEAAAVKTGNQFMMWALIGLFAMFSVYGIIKIAQSIVPGLDATEIVIPSLNFKRNGTAPSSPLNYTCSPAGSSCIKNGVSGTCNAAGNDCIPRNGPSGNTSGGTLGGNSFGCPAFSNCVVNGVAGECDLAGECIPNSVGNTSGMGTTVFSCTPGQKIDATTQCNSAGDGVENIPSGGRTSGGVVGGGGFFSCTPGEQLDQYTQCNETGDGVVDIVTP